MTKKKIETKITPEKPDKFKEIRLSIDAGIFEEPGESGEIRFTKAFEEQLERAEANTPDRITRVASTMLVEKHKIMGRADLISQIEHILQIMITMDIIPIKDSM